MKISIFSIPDIVLGKHDVKDSRLDRVDKIIATAKKRTYVQVELVGEDALLDADAILTLKDPLTELILKDLEFVETRLSRAIQESEKTILNKLKIIVEKEEFVINAPLSVEEKKAISAYGLITNRPIIVAEKNELDDLNSLLTRVLSESGFISFFTTGEKETRAWLIKKGTTCWESAGLIHSDIQKGFIRAEIVHFNDLIDSGGLTQAKQTGKLHVEQKDYVMQEADLVNFRFSK